MNVDIYDPYIILPWKNGDDLLKQYNPYVFPLCTLTEKDYIFTIKDTSENGQYHEILIVIKNTDKMQDKLTQRFTTIALLDLCTKERVYLSYTSFAFIIDTIKIRRKYKNGNLPVKKTWGASWNINSHLRLLFKYSKNTIEINAEMRNRKEEFSIIAGIDQMLIIDKLISIIMATKQIDNDIIITCGGDII